MCMDGLHSYMPMCSCCLLETRRLIKVLRYCRICEIEARPRSVTDAHRRSQCAVWETDIRRQMSPASSAAKRVARMASGAADVTKLYLARARTCREHCISDAEG